MTAPDRTLPEGNWSGLTALTELVANTRVLVVLDGADERFPGDEPAVVPRRCSRLSVIVTPANR